MGKEQGKIIILNGPSSSGKSTLAYALQSQLPEPYMHIGIDKLIGMMPAHMNDWDGGKVDQGFWWQSAYDASGNVLQHIQLGPYAHKVSQLLKKMVVAMADNGINVIVDEVCVNASRNFSEWKKTLAPYSVLYVGIHASVEKLEEREKQRGDRIVGSARAQCLTVHQDVVYDLELDTDNLSLDECANLIIARMAKQL